MQTLVQGIELILNNRPIEVDYDDDQEDILSPNHLIFGRQLPTTNMSTQNRDSDLNLSKRKKMLQTILNHFWSRWRREYVTSLRQFQKSKQNKSATQEIRKNDIVIIYDEKVPRHLWRLGRVVDIIPSRDCNIRAAKVKVGKTGAIINRPINKLYPLECSMTYDTEDNVNKVNQEDTPRRKREATITGELRRKFGGWGIKYFVKSRDIVLSKYIHSTWQLCKIGLVI